MYLVHWTELPKQVLIHSVPLIPTYCDPDAFVISITIISLSLSHRILASACQNIFRAIGDGILSCSSKSQYIRNHINHIDRQVYVFERLSIHPSREIIGYGRYVPRSLVWCLGDMIIWSFKNGLWGAGSVWQFTGGILCSVKIFKIFLVFFRK